MVPAGEKSEERDDGCWQQALPCKGWRRTASPSRAAARLRTSKHSSLIINCWLCAQRSAEAAERPRQIKINPSSLEQGCVYLASHTSSYQPRGAGEGTAAMCRGSLGGKGRNSKDEVGTAGVWHHPRQYLLRAGGHLAHALLLCHFRLEPGCQRKRAGALCCRARKSEGYTGWNIRRLAARSLGLELHEPEGCIADWEARSAQQLVGTCSWCAARCSEAPILQHSWLEAPQTPSKLSIPPERPAMRFHTQAKQKRAKQTRCNPTARWLI